MPTILSFPMITKDMFKWKKENGEYDEEKQFEVFSKIIKSEFKKDPEMKNMKDLEMVFFPIIAHEYYYLIVFNFLKGNTIIIDNSTLQWGDCKELEPRIPDRKRRTVEVEYEWQPPRCDTCKVFDHIDSKCPKIVKVADSQQEVDDDGFTKVSSKNDKGKNKGKNRQVVGIRLTKPSPNYVFRPVQKKNDKEASSSSNDGQNGNNKQQQGRQPVSVDKDINLVEIHNSFDSLMEKDKVLDVTESQSSQTHNDSLNEDDDEEVEDIYVEPDPRIRKQQVLNNIGASTPTDSVLNA
ncbi:hypothetical protein Tco_0478377 [Tanacetum coccineum]